MSTLHIYRAYTDRLGHLLLKAKISYEREQEWARLTKVIGDLRQARPTSTLPCKLRPGPVRRLLDLGLIPLLTDIVEDPSVRVTTADLQPNASQSAVSQHRVRYSAELYE